MSAIFLTVLSGMVLFNAYNSNSNNTRINELEDEFTDKINIITNALTNLQNNKLDKCEKQQLLAKIIPKINNVSNRLTNFGL